MRVNRKFVARLSPCAPGTFQHTQLKSQFHGRLVRVSLAVERQSSRRRSFARVRRHATQIDPYILGISLRQHRAGQVSHNGHDIAATTDGRIEHSEAVVGIVKGDPLDAA